MGLLLFTLVHLSLEVIFLPPAFESPFALNPCLLLFLFSTSYKQELLPLFDNLSLHICLLSLNLFTSKFFNIGFASLFRMLESHPLLLLALQLSFNGVLLFDTLGPEFSVKHSFDLLHLSLFNPL